MLSERRLNLLGGSHKMLEKINFPEELVANTSLEKFLTILRQRKLIAGL